MPDFHTVTHTLLKCLNHFSFHLPLSFSFTISAPAFQWMERKVGAEGLVLHTACFITVTPNSS